MKRLGVFIATTDGPAQIQRISRERAPLSMVILGSGSERLPVSNRYDDFARPGSGPVERFFGPFPEGGFRLEVSGPIESGDSWQLGVFLAHAIEAGDGFALVRDDPSLGDGVDHIIWLTGQVDYDGQVSAVGHVQEKFYASRDALASWLASGVPVSLVVPAGEDHRRLLDCELPTSARIIDANDAVGLCRELGIDSNAGNVPTRGPMAVTRLKAPRHINRSLMVLGAILVGTSLAVLAATGQFGDVTTWPKHLTIWLAEQTEFPPQESQVPKAIPPPAETLVPKLTDKSPVAEPAVGVSVHERRAPAGASCADVHFGGVAAAERLVDTNAIGQPKASRAAELCGLLLIIDAGPKPRYLRAKVTVLLGRLIDANPPPEPLSGYRPVSGPQRWALALPPRTSGPLRYRVTVQVSKTSPIDRARPVDLDSTTLEHAVLTN